MRVCARAGMHACVRVCGCVCAGARECRNCFCIPSNCLHKLWCNEGKFSVSGTEIFLSKKGQRYIFV